MTTNEPAPRRNYESMTAEQLALFADASAQLRDFALRDGNTDVAAEYDEWWVNACKVGFDKFGDEWLGDRLI